MPKNNVSDLITDQEMVFVRLVLSGTMTDREAAQAAGLNPDTAAYTKSKPRVRAYMIERRATTQKQLVEQEKDLSRLAVEKQRRREQRREQVLDRLWELSVVSPEMTRGSLTGQVKALSMIVAIEGLIPERRSSRSAAQPAAHPVEPDIYPAAPQVPEPDPAPKPAGYMSFPGIDPNQPGVFNPFINPQKRAHVATGGIFDAVLDKAGPLSLSFSLDKRFSGCGR
ncbi:MAG: hypothetical protein WCD57_07465 [Acidobacteriaceae bacterium]